MTREHKRRLKVVGMIVHRATILGEIAVDQPELLVREVVTDLWWEWKKRMRNRRIKFVEFNHEEEHRYVLDLLTRPLCEHLAEISPTDFLKMEAAIARAKAEFYEE